MEEAQDKKEIDKKLKEAKILIDEIKNYSNNLGERLYYNYCITDKESGRGKRYKNIKEFVHIHGNSRPTYETIDSLYTRYTYELAQVIIYMCDYRKELYHAYVYLEFLILPCTIYILAPKKELKKVERLV